MGNTCKSMADSFQCMTKPTTIKKKKSVRKKKKVAKPQGLYSDSFGGCLSQISHHIYRYHQFPTGSKTSAVPYLTALIMASGFQWASKKQRPFLDVHSYSKLATFIIIQHHIHRCEMFASVTQRSIYQEVVGKAS